MKKSAGSIKDLLFYINVKEWRFAIQHVNNHKGHATLWSHKTGFLDGKTTSAVLPIHLAVAGDCPVEMFLALHYAYPAGIKYNEYGFKRNVLHIACRAGCSIELIQNILMLEPRIAAKPDKLFRLPLHYLLLSGANEEICHVLLDACEGSPRCYDNDGWMPLHNACSVGAAPSVIRRLAETYPVSVTLCTKTGKSPFDCCALAPDSPNTPINLTILYEVKNTYEKSLPRPPKQLSSRPLLV